MSDKVYYVNIDPMTDTSTSPDRMDHDYDDDSISFHEINPITPNGYPGCHDLPYG